MQKKPRKLDPADRRKALELRRNGATFAQIGVALGIGRKAVSKLIDRELARQQQEARENAGAALGLELERLDAALRVASLPLPTQGRLLLIQVLVTRDLVGHRGILVRVPAVWEGEQAGGVEDDCAQGQHAQAKDARRQSNEPGHRDTPATSPGGPSGKGPPLGDGPRYQGATAERARRPGAGAGWAGEGLPGSEDSPADRLDIRGQWPQVVLRVTGQGFLATLSRAEGHTSRRYWGRCRRCCR
jgi:hypothetical protein